MGTILFHFRTSARKANNCKHVSGAGFRVPHRHLRDTRTKTVASLRQSSTANISSCVLFVVSMLASLVLPIIKRL